MKTSIRALAVLITVIAVGSCSNNNMNNKDLIPGFDLSNLDTTIAPSDDFYQFSTGGWQAANPIPETESRWGTFNILYQDGQTKITEIVKSTLAQKGEKGSDSQMIADFYTSAMDSVNINKKGVEPIEFLLKRVESLNSPDDFPEFLANNFLLGQDGLFGFYIGADRKSSEDNISNISQSGLTLADRDYYLSDSERFVKIREQYVNHVRNMFALFGYSDIEADKASKVVMSIETELAKISMSRIDRRNPDLTYNKLEVGDLMALTPDFNWNRYFEVLGIAPGQLIVGQMDFVKQLNSKLNQINIEDWKTYFVWHTVHSYASWLSDDFANENFAFFSGVIQGVKQMKTREKRVVEMVNARMGQPLGKLFVAKYFPESSKKDVENLIENLRAAYLDRVEQLDWMSPETKLKAKDKLNAFTYKIGYPDKWDDFSTLDIVDNDVIHNLVEVSKWFAKDNLSKLGQKVDKTEWGMTPQTVNAYYNPVNNEVVFPAGILQPPFYSPNTDVAINYGAIGGVIGHEFSHGFDDSGSKYDKNGNLNNWWTQDDRARFEAKTSIVVDQFDAFQPYEGVFVQGKLTLGENIADLGGLTISYYALQKHYEKSGGREDLAGFTPEQRFFLGWAQVWAANAREEYVKQQVTTDPHSPAKYRVNGPMSNMDEFRKAWGIEDGAAMARTGDLQVIIW